MARISFRDPVHNFVHFSAEEVQLIDLDVLQRLRGIRQLAMASLVYPGALHTRFDHTLGVAHVAGRMADELELDSEDRKTVRLAALLHDIGHGPFSHVSEYVLERFGDRNALPEGIEKDKIHEIITNHLIRRHPPIVQLLGQATCDRVAQLLSTGVGDPVLRAIVSGPLDADKQDYLLRDSQYAGVNYGTFDIHQLQRSLVREDVDGQKELRIRADGVHVIEQFVMAKYYLTTMVYRHKVRLISDQMIVRAIIVGIERDHCKELEKLYRFKPEASFYENYLRWNDARFMERFGEKGKASAKCTQLVRRLEKRQLFKRVFTMPVKKFDAESKERLLAITKKEFVKERQEIETAVAAALSEQFKTTVDPDFTILHPYQIKSVRESSRNDEASILVSRPGSPPGNFEDESVLFSSINERLADEYVEVYAPVSWSDRAERVRHLNALTPKLQEISSSRLRSLQLPLL